MRRWIRHALNASAFVAGGISAAGAQGSGGTGTITGQVITSSTRAPIQGAQVTVLNTTPPIRGTATAEGRFVLRGVPAGTQVLRAQILGYQRLDKSVTVVAGTTVVADVELREIPYAVAPVVVTALGIPKEERTLGYAVQTINAEALAKVPETTMMNALAGQSAGVQVTSAGGRPGAGARVTIRGETSFSGTGQPLFVIDGVPVSTETEFSVPTGAIPGNPLLGDGAANSRQMDFDMENIEDVSILRGAAATALYGSRAANGAIIIKTKTGKAGSPLTFSYNSEIRYDRPIINGYITDYTSGSNGYFCNGRLAAQGGWCEPGSSAAPETKNNWGPHVDSIPQIVFDSVGKVRMRDARADFYGTNPTTNNSIRGAGAMGDRGTYTLGLSSLNQKYINPVEGLQRINLNSNISLQLANWLQSTVTLQRIRSNNAFLGDGFNGIEHTLIDIPPNWDVRNGYAPDGSPIFWSNTQPSTQWVMNNENRREITNRWLLSQQFAATVMPGVRWNNNWGLDSYISEYQQNKNERPWLTAQGITSGSTQQQKSTRTMLNDDMTLAVDDREMGHGFAVGGLVGAGLTSSEDSRMTGNGSSIIIPDYFYLSNFATQTVTANLPTKRRILGLYSQVTAGYNKWAYLIVTGRNDWSSTLPTNANSYFYPSAALSLILTDAIDWHPTWLDFAKVRLSRAKVGRDAPPYSITTTYVPGDIKGANNDIQQNYGPALRFPFRGISSYASSQQLGNPTLRPESTIEDEVGLETRMFGGRARADISVYRKSSYDQIFNVPSSASSGFTTITRNAGNLQNQGVEMTLNGRPIEIGKFSWDARVNWSKNTGKILSLAPGVTDLKIVGYRWPGLRLAEGQPYGVIYGYAWKRNCDGFSTDPCYANIAKGALLTGDDGYPIRSDELRNLATAPPDWIGSFTSDFRYGNLTVNGLVDVRHGSHILNFETQYEASSGRSIVTEDRYRWVVNPGINVNTGQPNSVRVFKDATYFGLMYGTDRHENQVEPGGYVKLREISASYRLPQSLVQRVNLKGLSVYVTGRNLGVWSKFSSGDPEGDISGGQNALAQYMHYFSGTQSRSIVTGLRSQF